MKASKICLVAIVSVGFLLRLALWCFQSNPAGDDGARYAAESRNLVEHCVFSTASKGDPVTPSAHDMPLWPGTMAALLWATGGSEDAMARLAGLLNIAMMGGAVAFLLTMLGQKPFYLDMRSKAVAAAFLLFMPETIPYSLFHMPDSMALFFLCGAIACYFRGVYGSRRWLIVAAVGFALAILSKPICLPVAGAFVAALLFVLPETSWRRVGWIVVCTLLIALSLTPWVIRNQRAFGTAGLTTIAGTNLYSCNWGWMVKSWPKAEQAKVIRQNAEVEAQADKLNLMARSKVLGAYARGQILNHLKDYAWFTLTHHPRLYFGTGTIALLRYLGLDGPCLALGGQHLEARPITTKDRVIAWGLQGTSLTILAACYVMVVIGFVRGLRRAIASGGWFTSETVAWGCAFGGLIVLAVVIGPVTATRYRFIMVPFFALLAAQTFQPRSPRTF